jgi:hypothetical protein
MACVVFLLCHLDCSIYRPPSSSSSSSSIVIASSSICCRVPTIYLPAVLRSCLMWLSAIVSLTRVVVVFFNVSHVMLPRCMYVVRNTEVAITHCYMCVFARAVTVCVCVFVPLLCVPSQHHIPSLLYPLSLPHASTSSSSPSSPPTPLLPPMPPGTKVLAFQPQLQG